MKTKPTLEWILVFCGLVLATVAFILGMQYQEQFTDVETKTIEHWNERVIEKSVYNKTTIQYVNSEQIDYLISQIRTRNRDRHIESSKVCAKNPRLHELGAIEGWSMEPTLTDGDIPLGKKYSGKDELVHGDLITYRHGENTVLHRICGLYTDYLDTCSDNLQVQHKINYTDIEYVVCGVWYR